MSLYIQWKHFYYLEVLKTKLLGLELGLKLGLNRLGLKGLGLKTAA